MISEEVKQQAYKLALKNVLDYGKALEAPVLNKILASEPSLRQSMKELAQEIGKIIEKVNGMSREQLLKEFEPYKAEFEEKEEQKKEATAKPHMELEGAVVGDFAARFPPEPNGYIHIGNAKQAFLSEEFAKIYKGKLFLYFDDTNPEKDRQEYVDAIKKDLGWLGIRFDSEYYASDSIEKIYDYARQLLRQGNAYVCFCKPDEINRNRAEKKECVHRNQKPGEALAYFEDMLKGKYSAGEAVVRFKGDMKSENTVMRDPVIMRIKSQSHYRQGSKYIVWPTYYFNTPVNDSIHGVTDAIRSKEYELSDDLYVAILSALGLRIPRVHEMARLKILGTSTHKRELKELISSGAVSGYDDPRLVTIIALRRRGIQPEAIRKFVLRFGMSKTDSIVSMDMLLAENRKLIDGFAKRLFFVSDPIELHVQNMQSREVRLRLHPTNDLGYRSYTISEFFMVSKKDVQALKPGDVFCLKDLACVKVINFEADKIETSLVNAEPSTIAEAPKIQWVSNGNYMDCEIEQIGQLFVNGKFNENSISKTRGLVETYAKNLNEGDIVNFERVGFFKLDDKKQYAFLSL